MSKSRPIKANFRTLGFVRQRKKAFTLIELLAVVSIIAILAGLLLPTLGSAKRNADSARCMSNLRQLGIAVRLYADENEARLPIARNSGRAGTNAMTDLTQIQQVLLGYLSGVSNLFKCPADKAGEFEREGSSYEWNNSLNGRILHRIGQDRSEESSTKTYLLRDRQGWHPHNKKNAVFADGHAGPEAL